MAAAKSSKNADAAAASKTGGARGAVRWLAVGPGRWLVVLIALGAAGYGTWRVLWDNVGEHVLADEQYLLKVDDIHITPLPDWIRSDVRREVIRDGSLDGALSVLDADLTRRVAQAFSLHPWVREVVRVQKFTPARVEVELVYRTPVCMVEVPGGLYPIDVEGVLLPSADFSSADAKRYPRLSGIEPVTGGPVGAPWRDERVAKAACIAAALVDVWEEWGLERIVAVDAEPASAGGATFELHSHDGGKILWGQMPSTPAEAARMAQSRVAMIRAYIDQHGSLADLSAAAPLDLRNAPSASTAAKDTGASTGR